MSPALQITLIVTIVIVGIAIVGYLGFKISRSTKELGTYAEEATFQALHHMSVAVPDVSEDIDFVAERDSEEFQELRKTHRSFVFPMAIFFLVWYFAYVLLADYFHDFMSIKVFGNVNMGILLGLLQFVSTFVITGMYVHFSNKKLDPKAAKIRKRLEKEGVN